MRAVVQRVLGARVLVGDSVVGEIGRGLLVYLGLGRGDGERERMWMVDKVLNLRIFTNDEDKMDKSVLDVAGKVLVVSQFTLYGDVKRGRRPSFDGAMAPEEAEREYEHFIEMARKSARVETGRFGASMRVESANDGPVTIWLDTSW